MRAAHARHDAGVRTLHTRRVLDSLVPAILEQRVTGLEASRAWRGLVRQFGEPSPGAGHVDGCPADLMVAPDASGWRDVPSWAWHRAGVDPGRAGTALRAAQRAPSLERLSDRPPAEARSALRCLPGAGVWTAAEVAVRAWGDRDAVSFGDYHLAGTVVFALTGRHGGTDEQMGHLLEPWTGQRTRAVRLLVLHCGHPPRRGPRATITDHRRR
jgi:3-methyladenine DNA glycosylase/8-oxoguanine DNA glycosylase